jgi:hypothetical protein
MTVFDDLIAVTMGATVSDDFLNHILSLPCIIGILTTTKLLKSKSYRVRCAVVNTLTEIADESNRIIIIEHFEQALEREETVAVRSALESALSELEEAAPSTSAATASRRKSKAAPSSRTTSTASAASAVMRVGVTNTTTLTASAARGS